MIPIAQQQDGLPFYLPTEDRFQHLYVIGKTGTGKSTLLENLIASDILQGHGLAFIDPHGQSALKILSLIPKGRRRDVIYLDATDVDFPLSFNPLARVPQGQKDRVAANHVASFRHSFPDSWGPQMDWIWRNAVRLVLDHPAPTLHAVRRILLDDAFRERLIRRGTSVSNLSFWRDEYDLYLEKTNDPRTPIFNKLGTAISSPNLSNILCQSPCRLSMRSVMDQGRILIVNLSKGQIGEANAALLGALIVSSITNAALSRADTSPEERRPFFLYCDEFGSFVTGAFETVLSEARKYRLALTLSHQFLSQLPLVMQDAVLGNTGSVIAFRLGRNDAKEIAPLLGRNDPADLTDLPNYQMWGRFLRKGWPSQPVALTGFPPRPSISNPQPLINNSRAKFGRPRGKVEAQIAKFLTWEKPKRRKKRGRW